MFTFFVKFVNNDFFIFLKKKSMCKLILYCTENVSLNIAKWVYDIADCCYHDASCMLCLKKMKKSSSEGKGKKAEKDKDRLFCTGC